MFLAYLAKCKMTIAEFRSLALSFSETSESTHMSHPDFRIAGKIFATLWPQQRVGVVRLTPAQQASFVRVEPGVYEPAQGAWGRRGYTRINLAAARRVSVRKALTEAWRNTAPKRLLVESDS